VHVHFGSAVVVRPDVVWSLRAEKGHWALSDDSKESVVNAPADRDSTGGVGHRLGEIGNTQRQIELVQVAKRQRVTRAGPVEHSRNLGACRQSYLR